ncbi:MAG TPA: hypothetical protein VEC15_07220 [Actinomycetota bacterium]|nr:hypothetical protein [Actinomycetota bacterium]
MIRVLMYLIGFAVSLYMLAMTLSVLWGLIRFVIAAPGAIRADLEERRRHRPTPETGSPRQVPNEAPTSRRALPPARPSLPPSTDVGPDG